MINLDEVKLFLKVDHDEEDALISQMLEASKVATMDYLNWEKAPDKIPEPVASAMLLLVGDLYENRSLQGSIVLHNNPTYERLLNPYRIINF